MAKDIRALSGWVRQLRHRARKHNLFNQLDMSEIHEVLDQYTQCCCICDDAYDVLDMAFPLKDGGPNAQANVIPLCVMCKNLKKNRNILEMVTDGYINKDKFAEILKKCISNNNGDVLIDHIKSLSGNTDI
jgi:5-methylcytosine-specific restriction endonuclease McrA